MTSGGRSKRRWSHSTRSPSGPPDAPCHAKRIGRLLAENLLESAGFGATRRGRERRSRPSRPSGGSGESDRSAWRRRDRWPPGRPQRGPDRPSRCPAARRWLPPPRRPRPGRLQEETAQRSEPGSSGSGAGLLDLLPRLVAIGALCEVAHDGCRRSVDLRCFVAEASWQRPGVAPGELAGVPRMVEGVESFVWEGKASHRVCPRPGRRDPVACCESGPHGRRCQCGREPLQKGATATFEEVGRVDCGGRVGQVRQLGTGS